MAYYHGILPIKFNQALNFQTANQLSK